jgi:glycine/D-amino acid oxidase-like deaminating enzyme
MSRPEVLVVGAGVVGACVALRLAQDGARVTVVEAARPAAGASRASFAWANSFNKTPRPYHDLNVAGIAEHDALARELGGRWLHRVGNLKWELAPERQAELLLAMERLRSWGYPISALSPLEARELEPELEIDPAVERVVHTPEDSWVEVVPLIAGALAAAGRAGARVVCGQRVTAVRQAGGRVQGVRTEPGGKFEADVVVDCTGSAAAEVARLAGVSLAVGREPGRLVYTAPVATALRRLVHAPGAHFRPDGSGRIVLVDETHDLVVDGRPEDWSPERSVASAARYLPALSGVPVEAVRIGARPMPADRLPAVGPVPGADGLYLVVSHSGVTLGPLWGRLAAAEILNGAADPRLDQFRPSRLLGANQAGEHPRPPGIAAPGAGPGPSRAGA